MPRKILLADDSVTIQKVVELTFSEGDFVVTSVSNGKAAIEQINISRPDIILCDVIMPEINGYDVCYRIKHDPAFSAIPVVLLTGTFEPFDEEKAKSSGADAFVTKPFDSQVLIDKVNELIDKKISISDVNVEGPMQVVSEREEYVVQHVLSEEDEWNTTPQKPETAAMETPEIEESPFLSSDIEEVPPVEQEEIVTKGAIPQESVYEPELPNLLGTPEAPIDLDKMPASDEEVNSYEEEPAISEGAEELEIPAPTKEMEEASFDEHISSTAEHDEEQSDVKENAFENESPFIEPTEIPEGLPSSDISPVPENEIVHDMTDQQQMIGEAVKDEEPEIPPGIIEEKKEEISEEMAEKETLQEGSIEESESIADKGDTLPPQPQIGGFEKEFNKEKEPEMAEPAEVIKKTLSEGDKKIILDDNTIDDIAERIIAKVIEKNVKEIAWEVIPDLAEALIKKRIRELEETSAE